MSNSWENFGYKTEQPCCVCKEVPAQIEPRFGYAVCEKHYKMTLTEIDRLISLPKRFIDVVRNAKDKENE